MDNHALPDAITYHPLQIAMRECIRAQMHGVPTGGNPRVTKYILGRFNNEELDVILGFILSFDPGNIPAVEEDYFLRVPEDDFEDDNAPETDGHFADREEAP